MFKNLKIAAVRFVFQIFLSLAVWAVFRQFKGHSAPWKLVFFKSRFIWNDFCIVCKPPWLVHKSSPESFLALLDSRARKSWKFNQLIFIISKSLFLMAVLYHFLARWNSISCFSKKPNPKMCGKILLFVRSKKLVNLVDKRVIF